MRRTGRLVALASPVVLVLLLGSDVTARQHDVPIRPRPSDTGPLLTGTKELAIGLGGMAAVLGVLLYVIPVRAVAATRRRVETAMAERASTLQEEDRRRIARELHDGAGQALTAARLHLIALRERVDGHREIIGQIMQHLDEATDEVRRATSAMAPPALAELGLARALERHCSDFAAASELRVACELPDPMPRMDAYLETVFYRVVQEALHNVARHAGASRAWVRLAIDGQHLRLDIGDDGRGLEGARAGGFGLDSIRERVALAGGTVELSDVRGPGDRIRVRLPYMDVSS